MNKTVSTLLLFLTLIFQTCVQGAIVDVFIATGQSNAYWPLNPDNSGQYGFGNGVQTALTASGLFSNPTVVIDGSPGQEIAAWHNDAGPAGLYNQQFFDTTATGTGKLQAKLNEIIANGDTPRFRGFFWFQGETDGQNGTEPQYPGRWNGLLAQLDSDLAAAGVSNTDYKFVMNTVGNSGDTINTTLTSITDADARGVLFDTQDTPYRTNPADIHGYNHNLVGQDNVQLFIDTFMPRVDIFILAGQSNANGRGVVTDLTAQQSDQDAMFFYSWHKFLNNASAQESPTFNTQYFSGWLNDTVAGQTRAGVSTQNNGNYSETFGNSDWFGPEIGFVARANEINLTSSTIGILKYAVDGSALQDNPDVNPDYVSDWDTDASGAYAGDCWRGFQAALSNAVAQLQSAGKTPNFRGMIWWQGENGTSVSGLTNFIEEVRNHLGTTYGVANPSDFPVVITGNDFWGAGLEAGVADTDDHVGFIDSVDYGQIGGYVNTHIGSGENGQSLDVDANGTNDMLDIGMAYADEMALILDSSPPPAVDTTPPTADLVSPPNGSSMDPTTLNTQGYIEVLFSDIGDGVDASSIDGNELSLGGTGVGTAVLSGGAPSLVIGTTYRYAFTGSFVTGSVSVTFAAGSFSDLAATSNVNVVESESFTVAVPPPPGSSSVTVTVVQSESGTAGSTAIDLSADGDLDWGAWDGAATTNPGETMAGGAGFTSLTAIGATTFAAGTFRGENAYSWTNGTPTASKTSNLAGSASIIANGDGVRIAYNVASAGSYQLKFYVSTFDLNLDATATLSSGGVSNTVAGVYAPARVEKYEYTINFTTEGADTLTLDLVKNLGGNAIFAHEAFSLKAVSAPPAVDTTPPTADLASPANGSSVDPTTLNTQGYIEVTFSDIGDGVDASSIDGNELSLGGPGVGTAVLSGGAPSLVSGTTYRYAFTGDFVDGSVNVTFVAGSFSDLADTPNLNLAEPESFTVSASPPSGNMVDVFIATGQSNAFYPNNQGESNYYGFGRGAQAELTASGRFSNPTVVMDAASGFAIGGWWLNGAPNIKYDAHFFDTDNNGVGKLEARINEIIANGDTPRFRGLFWWQGESDGIGDYATANTSQADYEARWAGLLGQLEADLQAAGLDHTEYKFVVNTVAESGDQINTILTGIANADPRGVILDTQVAPYNDQNDHPDDEALYGNLHDYDHFAVGESNAALYISTFLSATTYEITFINVDGSQTTQTVNAGDVATPPAGVNSGGKTFTGWLPVAPATADATYTALWDDYVYDITFVNVDGTQTSQTVNRNELPVPPVGVNAPGKTFTGWPPLELALADTTYTALFDPNPAISGEVVDVFIATGQSNAYWGPTNADWFNDVANSGSYRFGYGVRDAIVASGLFSNPVIVVDAAPGQAIAAWWWEGDQNTGFIGPNNLYRQHFFGQWDGITASLEKAINDIVAAGNTPRFRGLFWFQGESDGSAGTSQAVYTQRWNGLLGQLATDLGINVSDIKYVMNTVGNSGQDINDTLAAITDADAQGVLLDTQVSATYRTNTGDIHGYNHYAVGLANAQLFIDTFTVSPPPPTVYDVTWDGEAGDGLWTSASNWSGDSVPGSGDSVGITDSNVTWDVTAGAGSYPADSLSLQGSATLTADTVIRFNGSEVNVGSNAALAGTSFYDFNGSTVTFDAGAGASVGWWEQKGMPTFIFNLDASGFTTLTPGTLLLSTGMSNVTYVVDMANYTGPAQDIPLVDFSNGGTLTDVDYQTASLIISNAGSYTASLVWDDASDSIILDMEAVQTGVFWDGEGGDGLWTTPANWSGDVLPTAGDAVRVGSNATVTAATDDFASLEIESGSSVTLDGSTLTVGILSDRNLQLDGALGIAPAGVVRLYGNSTAAVAGRFDSSVTFFDLGSTSALNFEDGAGFDAPSTGFQLRNTPTLGFNLSSSGFATIQAGNLYGPAAWSNVTFNIDISAYDTANGLSLTLMDFSSHDAVFDGTFNPAVHIEDGGSGEGAILSFDAASSRLMLVLDPAGNNAPVTFDQTVSLTTNAPVDFTLIASDVEGSNLTYTVQSQPVHGTLSGAAPDLTYSPTNDVFTFDSFTFTAFDGELESTTGTVTIARIPYNDNELWATYHDAIVNDALNTEWLTNWVENGVSIWQIRYDLGELVGTRTNASPKMAAYYGYPVGGTDLPGIVAIHGGGQRADLNQVKYWAGQGYATISINWGGLPLLDGLPNTDWKGLPSGFTRAGVTNAIFHNWHNPDEYNDGATLYDVNHPLNSSWIHNAYAARRALTFLSAQSVVDADKLGVLGWSMGGTTTALASTDPRLKCLGPGVGGTGFLFEDWWGLPGSARPTNGVDDLEMWIRTTDPQSYWPDVTAPTHYLEAANDFNAPFDLVVKALGLIDTNVPQRLGFSPHFNHRVDESAYAASVLWQQAHLQGTFDFPETGQAALSVRQPEGIPTFSVLPDTNTVHDIVKVDIYYGLERDSRIRFWRDAEAVYTNGQWEADCPVYDADEMMVALAVVTYDIGFNLDMPPGFTTPWTQFSVASEVITIYPPDLTAAGILETAERVRQIDDFTRGYKDWWYLNEDNPQLWQFWTRKLGDPSWQGPAGGALAFDVVTTSAGNTLGIQLDTEQWNPTDATSYTATFPLPLAGTNSLSLSTADFTNGLGQALTTWDEVKHMGLMPGSMLDGDIPAWLDPAPTFLDLRWEGGAWLFTNGVSSTWLESYGLGLNDLTVLSDNDLDRFFNWEEMIAGTDPTNDQSGFWFLTHAVGSGMMVVTWPAVAGRTYHLYSTTSLVNPQWELEQADLPYTVPLGEVAVAVDGSRRYFQMALE